MDGIEKTWILQLWLQQYPFYSLKHPTLQPSASSINIPNHCLGEKHTSSWYKMECDFNSFKSISTKPRL